MHLDNNESMSIPAVFISKEYGVILLKMLKEANPTPGEDRAEGGGEGQVREHSPWHNGIHDVPMQYLTVPYQTRPFPHPLPSASLQRAASPPIRPRRVTDEGPCPHCPYTRWWPSTCLSWEWPLPAWSCCFSLMLTRCPLPSIALVHANNPCLSVCLSVCVCGGVITGLATDSSGCLPSSVPPRPQDRTRTCRFPVPLQRGIGLSGGGGEL